MPKDKFVDFDRFLAEREQRMTTVRIFGRDCKVPAELPWHYVLKVDAMLRGGPAIPGEDNLKLMEQMFAPEDCAYITGHPAFRASLVWELIARTWLRDEEEAQPRGAVFRTEDDLKIERTRESGSKKAGSAR